MPICQKDLSANITTQYRSHFARVTAHEPLIPGYAVWAGIELDTQVQLGAMTVFHLGRPNVCTANKTLLARALECFLQSQGLPCPRRVPLGL